MSKDQEVTNTNSSANDAQEFEVSIKFILGGGWNEDYDDEGNEVLGLQAMRDAVKYDIQEKLDTLGEKLEDAGLKNVVVDLDSVDVDVDSLKPNRAYECRVSFIIKIGDATTAQVLEPLVRSWVHDSSFVANVEVENDSSEDGYDEYEVFWPKDDREKELASPIDSNGFGVEVSVK